MEIVEIFRNEINSAFLTAANHETNNSFMDCSPVTFLNDLRLQGYEPAGVSRTVPIPNRLIPDAIGFVFKEDGEIKWCHMSPLIAQMLLIRSIGPIKAEEMMQELCA